MAATGKEVATIYQAAMLFNKLPTTTVYLYNSSYTGSVYVDTEILNKADKVYISTMYGTTTTIEAPFTVGKESSDGTIIINTINTSGTEFYNQTYVPGNHIGQIYYYGESERAEIDKKLITLAQLGMMLAEEKVIGSAQSASYYMDITQSTLNSFGKIRVEFADYQTVTDSDTMSAPYTEGKVSDNGLFSIGATTYGETRININNTPYGILNVYGINEKGASDIDGNQLITLEQLKMLLSGQSTIIYSGQADSVPGFDYTPYKRIIVEYIDYSNIERQEEIYSPFDNGYYGPIEDIELYKVKSTLFITVRTALIITKVVGYK